MNLVEALTLAKEKGIKVRPKLWRQYQHPVHWVEYRVLPHGRFPFVEIVLDQKRKEIGAYSITLVQVEEVLGEWEIVE